MYFIAEKWIREHQQEYHRQWTTAYGKLVGYENSEIQYTCLKGKTLLIHV